MILKSKEEYHKNNYMKIVIAEPIGLSEKMLNEYKRVFSENGNEFVHFTSVPESENECLKRCSDADIIVISTYKLPVEILSKLENLKMISVAFTGYDHVDTNYCKLKGISVSNAAGYSTESVAEQSVLMILSLLRNAREMENNCRDLKGRNGFLGRELNGLKVGIIGFGLIGQRTAALLEAFSCEILVAERSSISSSCKYKILSMNTLLAEADVLSLHIPMSSENENFINAEALSKMKNTSFLINTARGGVVDSKALADALNNDKLAGAAIDIFEMEPPLPAEHPLLSAKNSMLMPHTAYATAEAIEKRAVLVLKNIVSWLDGKGGNVIA